MQAFQKSRESVNPCHWVSQVNFLFSLLLKMHVELLPCAQHGATGWCSCVDQGGASFSKRPSGQSKCSKCYEWTMLNSGWKSRRRKPKLLSVVQKLRQKVEGRGAGNSQKSPIQRSWWPAGSSNEGCGREGWRLWGTPAPPCGAPLFSPGFVREGHADMCHHNTNNTMHWSSAASLILLLLLRKYISQKEKQRHEELLLSSQEKLEMCFLKLQYWSC